MRPRLNTPRRWQRGGMMIMAVFAITALGVLGTALVSISSSQGDTTGREVLGSRAWLAATSGAEWALAQLFPLATDPNLAPVASCSATPHKIEFNVAGLVHCSATVTCQVVGTAPLQQYYIESEGKCGNENLQVSRILETWAKDLIR